MKLTLTLASLLVVALGSGVAHARDHQELVCTAVIAAPDDGDRVPLFIHFFDERYKADDRLQTLSTIYQGKLFQASHAESVTPNTIKLVNGKAVRFTGTYTIHNMGEGPFTLDLDGKINDDPSAKKVVWRTVKATLQCVDLSI